MACAAGKGVLLACFPPQPLKSARLALNPTAKIGVSDANPGDFRKIIPSL
jgi:hypothetical protein